MIRHIVLIRFRDFLDEGEIEGVWRKLRDLEGRIPGIESIVCGESRSPEHLERGYMHGFVVDFVDWDALTAYQAHPDHKRLGARIVDCAEGGLDGILVFDLPVG